jgi:hypothetical protein
MMIGQCQNILLQYNYFLKKIKIEENSTFPAVSPIRKIA